jgi:hypothetical protein
MWPFVGLRQQKTYPLEYGISLLLSTDKHSDCVDAHVVVASVDIIVEAIPNHHLHTIRLLSNPLALVMAALVELLSCLNRWHILNLLELRGTLFFKSTEDIFFRDDLLC